MSRLNIDLLARVAPTLEEIKFMAKEEIRANFDDHSERKLMRRYLAMPDDTQAQADFLAYHQFVESVRVQCADLKAQADLMRAAIAVEAATLRLTSVCLSRGRAAQIGDSEGVTLEAIAPLAEDDARVIQDEAERTAAQAIFDSASVEVLDLVKKRGEQ